MLHLDHLPNQKADEHIVLFLRRQWFAWASIIVGFVFMTGIPAVAAFYFWDRVSVWLQYPFVGPLIMVAASIYLLSLWLFSFLEFTDYYLDTWIITNDRVINIEQFGLFNRKASELHMGAVQDVTSKVTGIIGTFFDYGDVLVQTAAEHTQFKFKDVDHPEKVKETIIRLVEEYKASHAKEVVAAVADGTRTI